MQYRKKKVLYVITKGNFGGAQRYVFDLATSLPANDFETVVAFGEGGILGRKLRDAGVRTIEIANLKRDINPMLDLKTFFELWSMFRKEKPDIIHLNSSKVGGLGAVAGRLARIPRIIFTGHGWAWNEERSSLSKMLIKFVYWITILFCHDVIAVSENVATQIADLPGAAEKISLIYNGIAPFELKDGFQARQRISPSLHQSFWIGTISELHTNKGLDFLIEAFSRIAPEYPDCGLVIVGAGEERAALAGLISAKKLSNRVHLVGFVENARAYLKAFDIFTLTSRTEAFPYVLLEAGFAGLPVIASAVGGIPEIIEQGKTGLLVKRGDITEITAALSSLIERTKDRNQFGDNLKRTVESRFSQNEMVRKTTLVYNKKV